MNRVIVLVKLKNFKFYCFLFFLAVKPSHITEFTLIVLYHNYNILISTHF